MDFWVRSRREWRNRITNRGNICMCFGTASARSLRVCPRRSQSKPRGELSRPTCAPVSASKRAPLKGRRSRQRMSKPDQPIIIKKRGGAHKAHHGGAWKVAYADFVTAMMALFIVLWLMNSSPEVQQAVGGYFRHPAGEGGARGAVGQERRFRRPEDADRTGDEELAGAGRAQGPGRHDRDRRRSPHRAP